MQPYEDDWPSTEGKARVPMLFDGWEYTPLTIADTSPDAIAVDAPQVERAVQASTALRFLPK